MDAMDEFERDFESGEVIFLPFPVKCRAMAGSKPCKRRALYGKLCASHYWVAEVPYRTLVLQEELPF